MKPTLVADVGNSRIKWGRCQGGRVVESVSLPPEDPAAWQRQLELWNLAGPLAWIVAGVQPQWRARLVGWLHERGDQAAVLEDWQQLGLCVLVEQPERVGIDRLLNAVAARSRIGTGTAAVLVSAGSAVTVDWLDETGAFGGGAIFPGLRLMAQALRDYTALLPLVEVRNAQPSLPGKSTSAAIEAGIFWAVAGGIQSLAVRLAAKAPQSPCVFLTGGDAPFLKTAVEGDVILWPHMTLEGLRLAAERLP
jgi:type III pantothenate kinase